MLLVERRMPIRQGAENSFPVAVKPERQEAGSANRPLRSFFFSARRGAARGSAARAPAREAKGPLVRASAASFFPRRRVKVGARRGARGVLPRARLPSYGFDKRERTSGAVAHRDRHGPVSDTRARARSVPGRRRAPRSGPSRVRAALGASACTRRSAAAAVGSGAPAEGSAFSTSAMPSAMEALSHLLRFCSSRRIKSPLRRARAARRDSAQHEREQAHRLGLGEQPDQQARKAQRLAREIGARDRAARGGRSSPR